MNIRNLFDGVDFNNLICCLPHLSLSIIVEASTKDEELFLVSYCRVALSWSYLLVWVINVNFLPSYDAWIYHSNTHFRYRFGAKSSNQVATKRIVSKCATLSWRWDVAKSLGLNSYFYAETLSFLHSVNEVLYSSSQLFNQTVSGNVISWFCCKFTFIVLLHIFTAKNEFRLGPFLCFLSWTGLVGQSQSAVGRHHTCVAESGSRKKLRADWWLTEALRRK